MTDEEVEALVSRLLMASAAVVGNARYVLVGGVRMAATTASSMVALDNVITAWKTAKESGALDHLIEPAEGEALPPAKEEPPADPMARFYMIDPIEG